VSKRLRADLPRWNQLHSALDALHQTHIAVETYNRSNGELREGERFLAIYGLLQALVVQQDALCHLAESLQTRPIRLNRHKRLEEIRNIRNWTVGHPTKADRHLIQSHHAIRRSVVGRGGFALFSAFDDGRTQYTYVPLPQLARLQRRVISALLRDMLAELRQRDQRPPVVRATPRVQQAEPRVAPVASRWKQTRPLRKSALHSPKPPTPWKQTATSNGELHRRQPDRHSQKLNTGRQHGHRDQGNPQHANGNRKHNGHMNMHPEPRTWMQKVNPPPLLPTRRAARLAAQPIQ